MFERFTETARLSLFFTRYETTELGGKAIEPEHVLLGLLRADKGPTLHWFAVANLSYTEARAEILAHWGVRDRLPASVELPFNDQTERVLQFATDEADRLGHEYIGTGHLLLGILREHNSFAAAMLRTHGMTIDQLRDAVAKTPATAEPSSERPADNVAMSVKRETFDAIGSVERIRVLVEELARSPVFGDNARILLNEISYHLDVLKRHLAS